MITKCGSIEEPLFYISKDRRKLNWNMLQNCIKSGLCGRTGTAITNFSERLPVVQGKLAQEITKDTIVVSGKTRKIDMMFYHIHLLRRNRENDVT